MASVFSSRKKIGKRYVWYVIYTNDDGKQVVLQNPNSRKKYFDSEQEAKRFVLDYIEDPVSNRYEKKSFNNAYKECDTYFKKKYKPGTYTTFVINSKRFREVFLGKYCIQINTRSIKEYFEYEESFGVNLRTIQMRRTELVKFLKFCKSRNYIKEMPDFPKIEVKESQIVTIKKIDNFLESDILELIDAADADLEAWITLLIYTGIRPQEGSRIKTKLNDYDGFPKIEEITKSFLQRTRQSYIAISDENPYLLIYSDDVNKRGGIVKLTNQIIPFMTEYIEYRNSSKIRPGFLFPWKSTRYATQALNRLWKRIGKSGCANSTMIRHSYATMLLEEDVSIFHLAELMRNSANVIQKHYGSAELDKLFERSERHPMIKSEKFHKNSTSHGKLGKLIKLNYNIRNENKSNQA